jgi:hypothetical protein
MNTMSNHGAWNGTNRILCSRAIIQSYSVFPFWRETWAPRAQQRQTRGTQKSSGVCGLHTNGTIRHQLLRRRRLAAGRARGRAVREREGAGRGVLWRADGELLPRVCGLRVQAQRRQGTEWRTYDERATSRADKGTTVTRLASYRVIRSKVQTSKNSVLITLFSRSQPALITLFSKSQHSKYHFGEVSINSIIVKKKLLPAGPPSLTHNNIAFDYCDRTAYVNFSPSSYGFLVHRKKNNYTFTIADLEKEHPASKRVEGADRRGSRKRRSLIRVQACKSLKMNCTDAEDLGFGP